MKQKKIIIIGSGIGGLASACLLGKAGFDVDIFEKNKEIGGRVGVLEDLRSTLHQRFFMHFSQYLKNLSVAT